MLLLLMPFTVNAYDTSARCAILMDMDSKNVIYGENIHESRPIASISKIMTAILAIESGKMQEVVTVGEEILDAYGSGIYIRQGEQLKLEDLVYGLMLRSGNDASYAIAKYVGGDVKKFIELMNTKAKELGMNDSTFHNPNGLDDDGGNISSAYDMALLTSYAMKNEQYRKIVSTKKYTLKTNMNVYSWTNKHKLLFQKDYITGGKTGFTDVAKRTLVTTASKDNINLVAVTLNDGNDFDDHIHLFEEAFKEYSNYLILQKGRIQIIDEKYYQKDELYIENDFRYTLKENEKNSLTLHFQLEKKRDYQTNDKVGTVKVLLNDKQIHEENIYAKKGTVLTWWEKVKAWFRNLW